MLEEQIPVPQSLRRTDDHDRTGQEVLRPDTGPPTCGPSPTYGANWATVAEAIDRLLDEGPALGRPLADRIAGSELHNLKELRPRSSGGSEVRILFIFDPVRNAVLLVAGDKSGRWKEWYAEAIPAAEATYKAYLEGQR